ncbi:MAG: ferrous iron transport protein B, partial [Angelakisella sp.]
ASKNQGITELITQAQRVASQKIIPQHLDFCTGEVHRAIHSIAHLIEDHAVTAQLPLRFAATKLVEDDQPTIELLGLNQNERETVVHITSEMEQALGTDREAALADMRYAFIEKVTTATVKRPTATREQQRSVKIDNLLTHRHLAIPLFLAIMATIFWLTFGVIGSFFSDVMSFAVDGVTAAVSYGLTAYGINPVLHSLIIDGIFAGVGSVLSFLPTILVLFFFLSLLEDSGYMARVAFVMDKLLRKIGLSGKSFVPMLIGFGCTVPAVMSTRTLSSERDRKMTIILTPFMSCSAKLPVYALFTSAFFPDHGAVVMVFLYLLGMVVAVLYGLLLKSTIFKGSPIPFVMELPAYRLPSGKSILLHIWDKAKDFVYRAFTVIFLATIIIWVLQSFDVRGNPVTDSANSMLAIIGGWIAPLFAPLGFGNWMASTALVTGLTAKEAV